MRLLLHACCGPCSIHPAAQLAKDGIDADYFFYNPNIHPKDEYERRRQAFLNIAGKDSTNVFIPDYNPEEYYTFVGADRENPVRCRKCWELRLRKTAEHALANGYDAFTTTLLISPYQDHEAIKQIGERLSEEYKLSFHYSDFRPGFSRSQRQAKERGVYRQKYCGCDFSKKES